MTSVAATPLDAWEIRPEDYPVDGHPSDRLHFALRIAILAPSSHNSQPWLFQIYDDDAVDVFADRSRALPVVDPYDRELVMSCGAAFEALRIVLDAYGEGYVVIPTPDPLDFDLLVRLQLTGERREPDPEARRLLASVTCRHTNRLAFEDRPVPEDVVARMRDAVTAEGAVLYPVYEEDRHQLAEVIAEADRLQRADHSFRRELAAWMHPNRSRAYDGMRGSNLGMSDVMSTARPLVIRTFDTGSSEAAHDMELAMGSPLLAVLATEGDEPADWMAAGRALMRVLLVATDAGVSASFLDQPVEVSALRPALAAVAGVHGSPQLVLRFGYGPPAPASVRRPLEDVLLPPR